MDDSVRKARVTRYFCRCGKEHKTEALAYACLCYASPEQQRYASRKRGFGTGSIKRWMP